MEDKRKLLEELVDLGGRLTAIYYWGWIFDHKKEDDILKRMKEIVNQLI